MGKVIRCVDCQTPIRIPELDSPLLRTGNWVECRAKRAIKKSEFNGDDAPCDPMEPDLASNPPVQVLPVTCDQSAITASDPELPLELPRQTARLLRAKPWRMVQPLTSVDPEDCLPSLELESESVSHRQLPTIQPPVESSAAVEPFGQSQLHSVANLNSEQEKGDSDITRPSRWLLLLNKFFGFLTPATKEPPQSV